MKIIAAFKTHFDIGFTKLSREVIAQYSGKMLDDVLAACEGTQPLGKGREYVWTMASWPLEQTLLHAAPDKRARAEKLIERGQLVWHGLPFTTHTEFLSPEELDYGCSVAKRLSDKYGRPYPVSAKMTDVPGHTEALIRILLKNGIRFLHLGCNPASTPPKVPLLFWWEDKDGNRILTMYNNTYGSGVLPPENWPFPVWLAMRQTNDNLGPQGPEVIGELLGEVGDNELCVGTMDDFYREISACELSGLPVVCGDLGDTWIHGVGTYPREVAQIRRARSLLRAASRAAADSGTDISREKHAYFENVLQFGEHTWGLDVKTHLGWQRAYDRAGFEAQRSEPRYAYMEESWNEQRRRASAAAAAAKQAAEKAGIAAPPQSAAHEASLADLDDARADQYSPYSVFERRGKLYVRFPNGETVSPRYEYRVIPTQKMHDFMRSYLTRFWGWSISDFGRESYPESAGCINGSRMKYKLEKGNALAAEFEPVFSSPEAYGDCMGYSVALIPVSDGVIVRLALRGKQASPMLEAGNMVFAFSVPQQELRITKSGMELDPRRDIAEDANVRLFCLDSYAAAGSIALIAYDAPLLSFNGNAVYEPNTGRFMRGAAHDMTSNLFNNMWGTNFPQWTEGDMVFEWKLTDLETARRESR